MCTWWAAYPGFATDPKNRKAVVALASAAIKIPEQALQAWLFTDNDYYRPADGLLDVAALHMSLIREAAGRLK